MPALAVPGTCLVISPLIALMKDQVESLRKKGISCLSIYSGMSYSEIRKTLQNAAFGSYKFLYISPERLETTLFLDFLPDMKISLIAVDEAHCISQWGYDFRPSYLRIAALRELLPLVPVLALTASATLAVQQDICLRLRFGQDQQRFQQSFERPNLSYSVFNEASKQVKLLDILKKVKGSAIVYCKSRKQTKEVADLLNLNRVDADFYHAGLNNEERNRRQESWINNGTRVIACTNAFGMGIDKPDVRTVVHYGVPDCLENYYQEAGRAGRDGNRAYAVMLYNDRELAELELQSGIRYPGFDTIKKVYLAIMNFLQLPAGTGEGVSFDFDLNAFCSSFSIDVLTASFVIKTLEQEGILNYNEYFFKPSSVVFQCGREQLEAFEKQYPQHEALIKGLLRSYEGIISFPASINETALARFLRTNVARLKQDLLTLHQYGLLLYDPQKDTPQLRLVLNRMYSDSFRINLAGQLERKKQFEIRLKEMLGYTRGTLDCRSKTIAAYFNDHTLKACGICDNCINLHSGHLSPEDFEQINRLVLEAAARGAKIQDLIKEAKPFGESKLWRLLGYLQGEKKLLIDEAGFLVLSQEGIKKAKPG